MSANPSQSSISKPSTPQASTHKPPPPKPAPTPDELQKELQKTDTGIPDEIIASAASGT